MIFNFLTRIFWRTLSVMALVCIMFVDAGWCVHPMIIAGGIMAVGSIVGGLISSYGAGKAGEMSVAAQNEANMLNYQMFQEQSAEEKRRFGIQQALERLKMRLYKEEKDFTEQELLDNKAYSRANDFSNRIIGLSDRARIGSTTSAQAWAGQSQLKV